MLPDPILLSPAWMAHKDAEDAAYIARRDEHRRWVRDGMRPEVDPVQLEADWREWLGDAA